MAGKSGKSKRLWRLFRSLSSLAKRAENETSNQSATNAVDNAVRMGADAKASSDCQRRDLPGQFHGKPQANGNAADTGKLANLSTAVAATRASETAVTKTSAAKKPVDMDNRAEEKKQGVAMNDDERSGSGGLEVEGCPGEEDPELYGPRGFHPVRIGEVFNSRYEALRKLGYGRDSTVWLVKDLVEARYCAMKVLSADCYGGEPHLFEREILRHLRTASPNHVGYQFINHLLDDFEHSGPNGTHVCLIFDAMGETLSTYSLWYKVDGEKVPTRVMRGFTQQLLLALSYGHGCGVIHTDIKPDNIFVRMIRDQSAIEKEYLTHTEALVERQSPDEKYKIVRSMPMKQYYARDMYDICNADICLGDWGVASWDDNHLCQVIQPKGMRSPEVILGAGWDETTDLWNLGAALVLAFSGQYLVRAWNEEDGQFAPRLALLQMQKLFGDGCFPASLLARSDPDLVRACFDGSGSVRGASSAIPLSLANGKWADGMDPDALEGFAAWMHFLMKLEPRRRPSIRALLDHPWLTEHDSRDWTRLGKESWERHMGLVKKTIEEKESARRGGEGGERWQQAKPGLGQ